MARTINRETEDSLLTEVRVEAPELLSIRILPDAIVYNEGVNTRAVKKDKDQQVIVKIYAGSRKAFQKPAADKMIKSAPEVKGMT